MRVIRGGKIGVGKRWRFLVFAEGVFKFFSGKEA